MSEIYAKETIAWWKSQEGYEAGANKSNKYYAALDAVNFYNYKKNNQNINWCTGFYDAGIFENVSDKNVDFARSVVCEPNVDNCGAGCKQKVDYYKSKGRWIPAAEYSKAQSGDEIFYWSKSYISGANPYGVYHTGAIVDWSDEKKKFYVMEGNTGGGNGKVALKEVPYGASKILGFGHPFWTGWERPKDEKPKEDVKPVEPTPAPVPEPAPAPAPAKTEEKIVRVNTCLNVRKGPGTNYAIVAQLYNGTAVTVSETSGNWSKIGEGRWVCSDYLSDRTYTVRVNTFLNVRKGPSTDYPSVGRLYNGDKVTVSKIVGGWGQIGDNRWVSMNYVK